MTLVAGPSLEKIHCIIRSRIEDVVIPSLPFACPVHYDNQDFEVPHGKCWMRATIKPLGANQKVFGATHKTHRVFGMTQIQVFTPIQCGDKQGNEITDAIVDAFRGVSDGGVRFRTPRTQARRRFADEWMILINCPFNTDQIA